MITTSLRIGPWGIGARTKLRVYATQGTAVCACVVLALVNIQIVWQMTLKTKHKTLCEYSSLSFYTSSLLNWLATLSFTFSILFTFWEESDKCFLSKAFVQRSLRGKHWVGNRLMPCFLYFFRACADVGPRCCWTPTTVQLTAYFGFISGIF